MKKLFSLSFPAVLATGFLSWLVPVPDLPAGHEGICRIAMAGSVETILCEVPLSSFDLHLRALDDAGRPYETFEKAAASLSGEVVLAMNAGMYHEDRRPVGLTVQDGRIVKKAVLGTGSGNFSLRPNGIFYLEDGRAFVRETERYLGESHDPVLATQSGPMLLIGGKVHPRFIPTSDSLYVRNGVGVSEDGRTVFLALTRKPINFYDFALFFRDTVGVKDALFFDGQVSSLSYRAANIAYRRDRLGPMLLVTKKD